jgi:hypothetical protein
MPDTSEGALVRVLKAILKEAMNEGAGKCEFDIGKGGKVSI